MKHAVFHPDLDGITGEEEWDSMDARIFVLQVKSLWYIYFWVDFLPV